MFAIISLKNRQYKIKQDSVIQVPRMDVKVGEKLELLKTLLIATTKHTIIGRPIIHDVCVTAEVVSHERSDVIRTLKTKKRKNSKRSSASHTEITILRINKISSI